MSKLQKYRNSEHGLVCKNHWWCITCWGGGWAWTTYLLAGTGFALPIVIAMIAGGTGMLIYKDKIVEWLTNKNYKCSKCGGIGWDTK